MINLTQLAAEAAEHNIDHLYGPLQRLGFVITNTHSDQLSMVLFNNINKFMKDHSNVDIHLYAINQDIRQYNPEFAIFSTLELKTAREPLIAVDPVALLYMTGSCSKYKYYYPYSTPFLEHVKDTLVNNKITCIPRTEAHKLHGLQYTDGCVYDFEIESFLEIISAES